MEAAATKLAADGHASPKGDSQIRSQTRSDFRGVHVLGFVLFIGGLISSNEQGLYKDLNSHLNSHYSHLNSHFEGLYKDTSDWLTVPFQNIASEQKHLAFSRDVSQSLAPLPFTAIALAMLVWAVWESTKHPRHEQMISTFDVVRMFMQLIGDLLLFPIYLIRLGERTEVKCCPTLDNERILSGCPSLKRFKQMPLCRNAIISFGILLVMDLMGAKYKKSVERELLEMADGGVVALDWWGGKPKATKNKKILFVASTWTGDATVTCTRDVCKYFTERGWQCVVKVKRGCGIQMRNFQPGDAAHEKPPAPWGFDGFSDVQAAIDHISKAYPDCIICGIGHSLGGQYIRNYVHKSGSSCKFAAAVVVDSGEDWRENILDLDRRLPLVSQALKGAGDISMDACWNHPVDESPHAKQDRGVGPALRNIFLSLAGTVANVLYGVSPKAMQEELEPEGLMFEFVRTRLAPAHGYKATKEGATNYLRACQSADPAGCRVPTLELVSLNDLLIPIDSVRDIQKLHLASPNIITCVSMSGTHVVRWEGLQANCWMSKVAYEFMDAALLTRIGIAGSEPTKAL